MYINIINSRASANEYLILEFIDALETRENDFLIEIIYPLVTSGLKIDNRLFGEHA